MKEDFKIFSKMKIKDIRNAKIFDNSEDKKTLLDMLKDWDFLSKELPELDLYSLSNEAIRSKLGKLINEFKRSTKLYKNSSPITHGNKNSQLISLIHPSYYNTDYKLFGKNSAPKTLKKYQQNGIYPPINENNFEGLKTVSGLDNYSQYRKLSSFEKNVIIEPSNITEEIRISKSNSPEKCKYNKFFCPERMNQNNRLNIMSSPILDNLNDDFQVMDNFNLLKVPEKNSKTKHESYISKIKENSKKCGEFERNCNKTSNSNLNKSIHMNLKIVSNEKSPLKLKQIDFLPIEENEIKTNKSSTVFNNLINIFSKNRSSSRNSPLKSKIGSKLDNELTLYKTKKISKMKTIAFVKTDSCSTKESKRSMKNIVIDTKENILNTINSTASKRVDETIHSNKNINTIESLRTENNKLSYKRFHSHCFQQIKEAEKSCSNNLEKILKSHTKLDKTFRKSFRVKKIIDNDDNAFAKEVVAEFKNAGTFIFTGGENNFGYYLRHKNLIFAQGYNKKRKDN